MTKARQKQYLEGKVAPAGSRRPRARYVTSSQVKAAAGHRDDDATAARAVASAGGIEWGEGGSFDALKLPDIVGGGAVSQNTGAGIFDFHEQKQQQQHQAAVRDKRAHAARPAHL